MANKFRIITNNIVDLTNAALTDTPVSGSVENLQDYARARTFITTANGVGDETHTVFLTIPETRGINAIILGRHDFPINFQFRVYLYSDNNWTNQVYDSGILTIQADEAGSDIINWGEFDWGTIVWGQDQLSEAYAMKPNHVHWLDTNIVMQSMKIELYCVNQNVEISRLFIGNYIEPTYNISYGHTLTWVESTQQYRKGGKPAGMVP